MAIRDIVTLPDERLWRESRPVTIIDANIKKLIDDMFETMYDAPGIGLACIQIGEPLRIITMDLSKKDEREERRVFINAEIVWRSDEKMPSEEGCLSIPNYYQEVERPARVRVRYMNLSGETNEMEADGLRAVCLQHEIDHNNGILFIDYFSRLKRNLVIKKFAKAAGISKPAKIVESTKIAKKRVRA